MVSNGTFFVVYYFECCLGSESSSKSSIVMEGKNSGTDSSSVILIPSYDSDLSAGLEVARYYLSKSIKTLQNNRYDFFPIKSMDVNNIGIRSLAL